MLVYEDNVCFSRLREKRFTVPKVYNQLVIWNLSRSFTVLFISNYFSSP